jgi:hypothetical protein
MPKELTECSGWFTLANSCQGEDYVLMPALVPASMANAALAGIT